MAKRPLTYDEFIKLRPLLIRRKNWPAELCVAVLAVREDCVALWPDGRITFAELLDFYETSDGKELGVNDD